MSKATFRRLEYDLGFVFKQSDDASKYLRTSYWFFPIEKLISVEFDYEFRRVRIEMREGHPNILFFELTEESFHALFTYLEQRPLQTVHKTEDTDTQV